MGPIFFTGISTLDSFNKLAPHANFTVKWAAAPVPEFRLTETLIQTVSISVVKIFAGVETSIHNSLNISYGQLSHNHLFDKCKTEIRKTNFPPKTIR